MSSPYWAGTDAFSQFITPEKAAELHDYLLNDVNLPGMQFWLLIAKNNPDNQYGVIINDEKRAYDGYTLLCVFKATTKITGEPVNAVLIDMQGNVVNTGAIDVHGAVASPGDGDMVEHIGLIG